MPRYELQPVTIARMEMMTMKAKTRRSSTDVSKLQAVWLLAPSGRLLTQIATELGIEPSMVRSWRDR
jgi:transposase-like protein